MDHQNNPPYTHNELLSKHTNTFKLNEMFCFSQGKFFYLGLEPLFNYFSMDSPLKWVQKWNKVCSVWKHPNNTFCKETPYSFFFWRGRRCCLFLLHKVFPSAHFMREKPLNSIFWFKTQFCFISSLCRAQSLKLSIPPALLKTPHQKLCTNPANSSSEINLLCLLINIYSDIYQENMKGKPNICISSIACWGISLWNKEKRATLWSPLSLLVKISFPPFKPKRKFWFTLGAMEFLSAKLCSPVQLLCKTFCCYGSEKAK